MHAESDADGAGGVKLLGHDRVEAEVLDPRAAIAFRQFPTDQSQLAGLEPGLTVDVAALLPLIGVRHADGFVEGTRGCAEVVVFGLEDVSPHRIPLPIPSSLDYSEPQRLARTIRV